MKNQKAAQLLLVYNYYGNGGRLKKNPQSRKIWSMDTTPTLEALREMLPFLSASGHNLYT